MISYIECLSSTSGILANFSKKSVPKSREIEAKNCTFLTDKQLSRSEVGYSRKAP